ncbi:TPA: hypothetical protein NJ372_003809 [Vibrio parahaemolyticus]|nr:hypothetical protein [Vibrio parahaemolyticus]
MEKLIEFLIDRKLEQNGSSITHTFYYNTVSLELYKVIGSEEVVILAESHVEEEFWSNDNKLVAYRVFKNESEYDEFFEECRTLENGELLYLNDFQSTINVFRELEEVEIEDVNRYIERYDLWEYIND